MSVTDSNFDPVMDGLVWGAEAIGKWINRNERQTYDLIGKGLLDVDQFGAQYVSTPRRLLKSGKKPRPRKK